MEQRAWGRIWHYQGNLSMDLQFGSISRKLFQKYTDKNMKRQQHCNNIKILKTTYMSLGSGVDK